MLCLIVRAGSIFLFWKKAVRIKSSDVLPLSHKISETHARQRRFVIHAMSELRKTLYGSYPMTEAPPLLVALAKSPEDWSSHLEQYTSRIISRIAYGTPEHAKAIKDNAQLLLEGVTPTAKFVNLIPPLKRLPTWLSPWRMAEEKRSKAECRMFLAFQQGVRDRIATQKADISMTQIFFELKDQHRFTSDVEGAFCVGMLATTVSMISCFDLVVRLQSHILLNEVFDTGYLHYWCSTAYLLSCNGATSALAQEAPARDRPCEWLSPTTHLRLSSDANVARRGERVFPLAATYTHRHTSHCYRR